MELSPLRKWADMVRTMEFPYCDAIHENVDRERTNAHSVVLLKQCPVEVQLKRPGCLHCRENWRILDPIEELVFELDSLHMLTKDLKEKVAQYHLYICHREKLDHNFRNTRTGALGEAVPNTETAEKQAAPLVTQHRQMIDRIKQLCCELLTVAENALANESETVQL